MRISHTHTGYRGKIGMIALGLPSDLLKLSDLVSVHSLRLDPACVR